MLSSSPVPWLQAQAAMSKQACPLPGWESQGWEAGGGFPTAAAMSQCPGAGVANPTPLLYGLEQATLPLRTASNSDRGEHRGGSAVVTG